MNIFATLTFMLIYSSESLMRLYMNFAQSLVSITAVKTWCCSKFTLF